MEMNDKHDDKNFEDDNTLVCDFDADKVYKFYLNLDLDEFKEENKKQKSNETRKLLIKSNMKDREIREHTK